MNKLTPPLAHTVFFAHEYEQYLVKPDTHTPHKTKRSGSFDYLPYVDIIAQEITLIKSAEVADVRRSKLNAYAARQNKQTLASFVNDLWDDLRK